MQIAVIGAGNIGSSIGKRWEAAGHTVIYGVRDPQGSEDGLRKATLADAVAGSEVVLLAVPAAALPEVLGAIGTSLGGRLVIDATNRFGAPVVNSMATIADYAPTARLIRAFNSLGWENFANPSLNGTQIDLFYCSPPGEPEAVAEQLIGDCGLRPVRVGDLEQAPLVDAIGSLWGALVFGQGHPRRLAFKLISEA